MVFLGNGMLPLENNTTFFKYEIRKVRINECTFGYYVL